MSVIDFHRNEKICKRVSNKHVKCDRNMHVNEIKGFISRISNRRITNFHRMQEELISQVNNIGHDSIENRRGSSESKDTIINHRALVASNVSIEECKLSTYQIEVTHHDTVKETGGVITASLDKGIILVKEEVGLLDLVASIVNKTKYLRGLK